MINPQQRVPPFVVPEGYLTIPQVAAILRCDKRTVQKMIACGVIASSRMPEVQRRILVSKVIFDRYCQRNAITVDAQSGQIQ